MRVLLVEGDADIRFKWAEMFGRAGHQVTQVSDVHDARRCLMTADCDVAVIELSLRDGSGLTAAKLSKLSNPHCNIIIVTKSNMFPHGEIYDLAPDIAILLRKPIAPQELLAVAEYHYEKTGVALLVPSRRISTAGHKRGDDTREEEGAAA